MSEKIVLTAVFYDDGKALVIIASDMRWWLTALKCSTTNGMYLLHDMKTSENEFFDLSRAFNSAIFNLAMNWSLLCAFFPLFFPHGWEIAFLELWKQPLIRVNFCVAFYQLSSPSPWLFMFIPNCRAASFLLYSSFVFMSMNFEKNMLRSSLWWWQQFGFHIFLSSRHYLVLLQCLFVCICFTGC